MKRTNKTEINSNTSENLLLNTHFSAVQFGQLIPDLPIIQISKEFFPDWVEQKPRKYICPICGRPHHKGPGPFTYGITINKNERMASLWVQSFGCCKSDQCFPYDFVNSQKINTENIIPILKKVFLSK